MWLIAHGASCRSHSSRPVGPAFVSRGLSWRPVLACLPAAALHVVEGGDHSFKVQKRGGLSQDQVYERVLDTIAQWLREKIGEAPA